MIQESLKDSNWHLREECLMLVGQVIRVSKRPTKEFITSLIENIIELLDDSKPKVRFTARETITILLQSSNDPN
jgi:hypothetical protein